MNMAGDYEEANKENNLRIQPVTQAQINQFKHGSIRKIVFINFLTYDNLTCSPGPFLNVVIGPNGTGKSTIICGICLAVAGRPNLLGRSDSLVDYVKHGKQQGSVELHIWDATRRRDMSFKIIISINKNAATYLINGQNKKVTEYREEISQYNIQVDNPCTFLAQDKVKSFAEQGPQKLLRNTEKAGPNILSEAHNELVEMADEGGDYESRVERLRKQLDNLRVEISTRKERVDSYLEWSNRNKTLKLIKLREAYIEYESHLEILRQATIRVDESQQLLDQANANLNPKDHAIRGIENILKELDKELEQLKATRRKEIGKIRDMATNSEQDEKLQNAADQLEKTQNDCENWNKDQNEMDKGYRKFKQMYETKKLSIVPDPDLPNLQEKFKNEAARIRAEEIDISERQKVLFRLDNQYHSQTNQRKNNMDSKLRNIVQMRNNANIMQAYDFYLKNREKFRGPVYIPFLDVHIPNANNLPYFNNYIKPRDMGIFIFSCREDEELLGRQFNIDSSIVSQNFIEQLTVRCHKTHLPNALKQMGFIDYLYNMFEAPEAVSAYLNGFYHMDQILIGGPEVDLNYEKICKQANQFNPAHRLFMTRKLIVSVTASRYDRSRDYTERNYLNLNRPGFGPDHVVHLVEIDRGMEEMEQERRNLNRRQTKLLEDKENLKRIASQFKEKQQKKNKEQEELDNIAQQVRKYENRMRAMPKEKPNLDEAKKAYLEAKRTIVMESMNNLEKMATMLEKQRKNAHKYALKSDEVKRLKWRIDGLGREKEGMKENLDQYKRNYREMLKERANVKEGLEFAKNNFKEDAKFSPTESEMSQEQKQEFTKIKEEWAAKKIPNTQGELTELYRQEQAKASKRQEGTQKDVDDYENLIKELKEVSFNIEKTEAKNDKWKQKMDEKLDAWLLVLRKLVTKINKNFSAFFIHLRCEGEVRLFEPENKYKVGEYGIKIYAKFRDGTALRELDCHTQSGGERSVATMLYIMALQNLCPVPFRCVDEINQGMDPTNERAVFNMMVNLLNSGDNVSKTQYFLLTPKLLSGLQFNDRVCVHIVHNGPAIDHPEHWDVDRILDE